jgi:hypothetical protein
MTHPLLLINAALAFLAGLHVARQCAAHGGRNRWIRLVHRSSPLLFPALILATHMAWQ